MVIFLYMTFRANISRQFIEAILPKIEGSRPLVETIM